MGKQRELGEQREPCRDVACYVWELGKMIKIVV